MKIRYLLTVPLLYLGAVGLLGTILGRLSDRVWARTAGPAVVLFALLVFVPTTAWLARRAGSRWKGTTALHAAVAHALAAVLVYALAMTADSPRRTDGGLEFDIPRLQPGIGEMMKTGLISTLAAAAVGALLSIPVGAVARAVGRRSGEERM